MAWRFALFQMMNPRCIVPVLSLPGLLGALEVHPGSPAQACSRMLRVAVQTWLGAHGIASAIWQHPWSWDPGIYATNSPSAQKIVEGVLCSMTVCHASVTFKCLRCQALNSSCEWSQWSVLSSNRVSRFRLNFRIGGILQCKSPSFSKRGRGCLGCRMMAGA
jgi:hypothetical protein